MREVEIVKQPVEVAVQAMHYEEREPDDRYVFVQIESAYRRITERPFRIAEFLDGWPAWPNCTVGITRGGTRIHLEDFTTGLAWRKPLEDVLSFFANRPIKDASPVIISTAAGYFRLLSDALRFVVGAKGNEITIQVVVKKPQKGRPRVIIQNTGCKNFPIIFQ